jgi:SAM-dependent methyltransferase
MSLRDNLKSFNAYTDSVVTMPEKKDKPIALDAYEKLADAYAAMVDTKPHNAYLERPATLSLLPEVLGKRVLDAGCGPGAYSDWLVEHGAEVHAVDASPRMVELTRERLGGSVDVRRHDLREPLPWDDGYFDVIISPLVMDYVEDWVPVFNEYHRLLKADGTFVFSVEHPFTKTIWHPTDDYFRTELGEMTWKGFGVEVSMPSYRRPLEAMIEPLHEAGFLVERILEPRPTEEYRTADPEGYEVVSKRATFLCVRARRI